jgi:hypothetical protein
VVHCARTPVRGVKLSDYKQSCYVGDEGYGAEIPGTIHVHLASLHTKILVVANTRATCEVSVEQTHTWIDTSPNLMLFQYSEN